MTPDITGIASVIIIIALFIVELSDNLSPPIPKSEIIIGTNTSIREPDFLLGMSFGGIISIIDGSITLSLLELILYSSESFSFKI